jgi:exodeoxyribonuclease VII large subunit
MKAYSLYELNEYIKRVVALNFAEAIWIKAEISQIRESRGQIYMDLIEKDEKSDEVIAQSSAIIWYKSLLFIKKKLGELADSILQDGVEISLKVTIAFHERYGLKLNVEDIDASYTMGQLELNRQKIISRLRTDGFLEQNELLPLPTVLQNIAVISSRTAAGFKDFEAQLVENSYGYFFKATLFHVAVQGRAVSKEVCEALDQIVDMDFDAVVIIRGGGSKIDLSGFDDYNIGAKIAKVGIPVIAGIGHEIDNTVTDIVAHTSLKTPTAVADYLIDHNLHYESELIILGQEIADAADYSLRIAENELQQHQQLLDILPAEIMKSELQNIDNIKSQFLAIAEFKIKNLLAEIDSSKSLVDSMNPDNLLKKGFTYILKDKKIVSLAKKLKSEDHIEIVFQDGKKKATIT